MVHLYLNSNKKPKDAKLISNLVNVPLIEELPKGFMSVRTGKRSFNWIWLRNVFFNSTNR